MVESAAVKPVTNATPVAASVATAPAAPTAPVATPPAKSETSGSVGAGPDKGTPAEGQAKKLYIMA